MASPYQTANFELKDMLSEILKMQSEIMKTQTELVRKVDTMSTEVKHLGNRLSKVEKSSEASQNGTDIYTKAALSQEALEHVHESLAATVCFNSPMNVMFYGIENNPQITLDSMIRKFMYETLSVDEGKANNMAIHVQYLPKMSYDDVHSPICVSFRSHKDKELIRKNADKNKSRLRELGIWIKAPCSLRLLNSFSKWISWEKEVKMQYLWTCGQIALSFAPCQAAQMCTSILHKEASLPDIQILNLTLSGVITCLSACLIKDKCMLFNFNLEIHECQLNSKAKVSTLTQSAKQEHFAFSGISHCKVIRCLRRTVGVSNAQLLPRGTVLPCSCDTGNISEGELVCQDDGTRSSPACVSVSFCSMVKQYQPDSEDGGNWLRLTNFDNYTTKIYCHNMTTPSPKEFLTLPNISYGIYPKVANKLCSKTELYITQCQCMVSVKSGSTSVPWGSP